MNKIATENPDVFIFEPSVFGDDRGFFMETFRQSWFDDIGQQVQFVQSNHSRSKKGVLRGLHYQVKQPQGKLVRVTSGTVYDVAVDIRPDSKHFGQHVAITLSEENKRLFWVPPGFAHGFLVLSDFAELQYQCTDYYAPEYEHSILWSDPELGIQWPEFGMPYSLSEKDERAASFAAVNQTKIGE
ncbi:MAG: dTDP-4-dehydrorhamnose 3,5-epimerase [Cyanobacteria bacterium P01_F01_bin.86]